MKNEVAINYMGRPLNLKVYLDEYTNGGALVTLECMNGAHFCTVSVWVDDTPKLLPDVFYVKAYSENHAIIPELVKAGMLVQAQDVSPVQSEFVTLFAYRLGPEYTPKSED